ncbi:antizyme inhibitor 1a [Cyprinodon tularosa]|uniref:antizyme inhibitor 1a n=1 Tax=Cyprinodon tularosa TaxID=77115 RepID=UPI0018E27259|nr:antizyme inhibitor 1a [Cyprinodon tularosa]XP_038123238.1 antizyme inhibitor 1a [Cyprinodon tularosa]XP_038123239.1 antizyme inhibitor 1a [Cyprinodon tularosa]XP_038123240.1 antizyme inhibitor 1a [Cyprinodon tularosa]XP_038123241.1 antizyme inhibitor 1a [Cyprinodon tularosa]XP_038123242.1 antizyme inhibitor 1a [Cyprinodon tularosa]XP_038123243.1 antizyme inhibitor 1a [Cyprinodon tularosa]XP_038123244.1 antizyme inhibitor 1a [Cyprinodon tularosa]XP_038123245.1 antizyme inhibitor 1a [Cypri
MKGITDEPQYSVSLLDGGTAFCDVINNHIEQQTQSEKKAFFVADLGVILRQHRRWRTHMPQIRPYYAVRCNSSPAVIEVLAALGSGFTCSNKSELELVQSHGIPSEDIIYSGVCKQVSHLKYTSKNGIDLLVCDNEAELRKISRCHPNAKLLLQVSSEAWNPDDELGMTFGCSLKDCRHLLESAKELGVQVVGVRCHISSACDDQVYVHAISDARCIFDMGEEMGFRMNLLDIGGGFSGSETRLEMINCAVMSMVDLYFPSSSGVSIIAEPGSFFVSTAFTLAVSIISKAVVARDCQDQKQNEPSPNEEPEFQYYMCEGVYGSFSSKLSEAGIAAPSVHKNPSVDCPLFSSSLWGPSGDDLDQVVDHCLLPELNVGDWLLFAHAGAYTLGQPLFPSSDSTAPPVYYVISSRDWIEMQDTGVTVETMLKNFSWIPYFISSSQTEAALSVPA